MNEIKEPFRSKFRELLEQPGEISIEQLKAEYALLQECRELISRQEDRTGDPRAVKRMESIDQALEWMQGNITRTINILEDRDG